MNRILALIFSIVSKKRSDVLSYYDSFFIKINN